MCRTPPPLNPIRPCVERHSFGLAIRLARTGIFVAAFGTDGLPREPQIRAGSLSGTPTAECVFRLLRAERIAPFDGYPAIAHGQVTLGVPDPPGQGNVPFDQLLVPSRLALGAIRSLRPVAEPEQVIGRRGSPTRIGIRVGGTARDVASVWRLPVFRHPNGTTTSIAPSRSLPAPRCPLLASRSPPKRALRSPRPHTSSAAPSPRCPPLAPRRPEAPHARTRRNGAAMTLAGRSPCRQVGLAQRQAVGMRDSLRRIHDLQGIPLTPRATARGVGTLGDGLLACGWAWLRKRT